MTEKITPLEKAILSTLAYYDVLERPLTGWEVFKFLNRRALTDGNVRLYSVLKCLRGANLAQHIGQKRGFYFLRNACHSRESGNPIKKRIERQKTAECKWKKVKQVVRFLQMVPFVRLIMVSGSLAQNNTSDNSDMDLLIVFQAGRIWTARALVTGFVHLSGCRKRRGKNKDGICLNHYLTDSSLKVEFASLYNAQTYASLTPLLDYGGFFEKFRAANNWLQKYLLYGVRSLCHSRESGNPGFKPSLRIIKTNRFFKKISQIGECILSGRMGNYLERKLKKWQISHIIKTEKEDSKKMNREGRKPLPGRVLVSDSVLEFHPASPEWGIIRRYNQKMKELGLHELANEADSGLTV